MIRKCPVLRMTLFYLILAGWLFPASSISSSLSFISLQNHNLSGEKNQKDIDAGRESLDQLNISLRFYLMNEDLVNGRLAVEKILKKLRTAGPADDGTLSSTYFLAGIYFLKSNNNSDAIKYLALSAGIKEKLNEYDERYAKILYNLGVAYYNLGDFTSQEHYTAYSFDIEKRIYGESSPLIVKTCNLLALSYLSLQEYEKSLELSKMALSIAGDNQGSVDITDQAAIYNNLGVTYIHLADYSKAKVYLEKTESFYKLNRFQIDDNYFGLLNNMAITYGFLGLSDKSNEYYEKGIYLADSVNSVISYNYINSYAIVLGNSGNRQKGESLLHNATIRAKTKIGEDSQVYFSVLFNYAEYLRDFKIDNNKALECYKLCVDYLEKNNTNLFLKDQVYLGYSLSLSEKGENDKALEIIQSLLFTDIKGENAHFKITHQYDNPEKGLIKTDKLSLRILQSKYKVLWNLYNSKHDPAILKNASATAKLIVEVLEKVRINISEEDSRLILGDRYRDSYINAIRDFNLLYRLTGEQVYLEDAFEYFEKSKVAGLLASTRELNASQFNIPSDLAEMEKKLKRDISILNAKISEEIKNEHPDTSLLNAWKENILKNSLKKDSLVTVLEKKYPGYYLFKYNSSVTKLSDLPGLIGRDGNYLNYIISDTIFYVFVANRQKRQLLAFPADSSFYSDIKEFRSMLGMPSPSGNAREAFENFQKTGYRLYQKIIEPIRPYLISKKLLISPDNILSYIPFETIPVSPSSGNRILYNQIPYLMNEFDISYTYSVTFLAESLKSKTRWSNRLIAFAPSYTEPIDIGTVMMKRQIVNGVLPDLPYAKQEAEYVASLTHGTLYENEGAKETVFKNESGKYDVIHLAMHTILNDREPMYSTLIFSSENDSVDDRYLKTYEVYSIPLKAKMVVLSSCNSGTGYLYSGEGILSLARGFMYSGSKSVVMAMWEIEDRSGTEIVKGFYDNLKKGYSKSSSLRKARIRYLMEADQLRSHPYFWSTLVVYGDNSPLYYPKYLTVPLGIAGIIVSILAFYLWRRKNS
jgi:CHAT domain-containing protein